MKTKDHLFYALFAISAIGYFSFAEWMATARVGTMFFLWFSPFYVFPLLAALLALPVLLVRVCFQRDRTHALPWLLLSILYIPCFIVGTDLGDRVRISGWETFARRSQPLIHAIEQYADDHAVPPQALSDLVPDYLPEVPNTGMRAYPEFHYDTGDETRERFAENPWVLSVFTPSGAINFDQMLYFPKQNYPKVGYGGGLERIGDWAYVHE